MPHEYPEPNPVQVSKSQLAWAQEMHQTNVRVAAEQLGEHLDAKPKRRWWHRADPEPKQT